MHTHGVIVVGAGVIGASIAYHLAARGEQVAVIDAGLPGSGATRHSFAWISPFRNAGGPAVGLRELSRDDWMRVHKELPGLELTWSGALISGEDFARPSAPIVPDPTAVEPRLTTQLPGWKFSADEGWIEPVRVTEQLLAAARERGATTRFGEPALRLIADAEHGIVGVDLGHETLRGSSVVIAAGTGSATLCEPVDARLPLVSSPSVLVRLSADPGLISRIVANDEFEARQAEDGTILMPLDYDGEETVDDLARAGETARRVLADAFDGAADARVTSVEVGWRPMTRDHEPAVGPAGIPGLYIAVAHPGVTLAATIGRLAADEIISGTSAPELAPFRPSRFEA